MFTLQVRKQLAQNTERVSEREKINTLPEWQVGNDAFFLI
jgi:hypothetical protein